MRIGATLAFLLGSSQSGKAEPCCQTCESGKEKYFSIPEPSATNPQCGECCLDPSKYKFWRTFEPKLLKGDCASQGFTKYVSTETDGVWPLQVTNDRYVHASMSPEQRCPDSAKGVFADMHDGDKKEVTISGSLLTITPSGNNETWMVQAEVDHETCSAIVDFNVPGKPNPPPVNLSATLWSAVPNTGSANSWFHWEIEFTDPSGKLAKPGFPLNRWVQLGVQKTAGFTPPCPQHLQYVYQDMHDGDMKVVSLQGTQLRITPSTAKQNWTVTTIVDSKSCSAIVNFDVPGKPNPPPVNLKATILSSYSSTRAVTELEFTDPSGKLAAKDFPLNHWVSVSDVPPLLVRGTRADAAHTSDSEDMLVI